MKRLFNFLRGMATVVASGPFPERFLNLCAQERIDFWAVAWLDGHTLRLTLRAQTLARAEELARRAGCALRVERRQGLAVQLSRFRRRYGFLAGLSLSLCAVAVLSQFVLTIQVTDDGQGYPPAVLAVLQAGETGENPPHILGLHVVEQILAAHGGTAAFAQALPHGAVAALTLPL